MCLMKPWLAVTNEGKQRQDRKGEGSEREKTTDATTMHTTHIPQERISVNAKRKWRSKRYKCSGRETIL